MLSRLRIEALIRGQDCDHDDSRTAFLARFILFTLGITTFVVIALMIYAHVLDSRLCAELGEMLK